MTKDELEKLIEHDELLQRVDVKTLVLDLVKDMDKDEWMAIFWKKLPELKEEQIRDYFYMRRG